MHTTIAAIATSAPDFARMLNRDESAIVLSAPRKHENTKINPKEVFRDFVLSWLADRRKGMLRGSTQSSLT